MKAGDYELLLLAENSPPSWPFDDVAATTTTTRAYSHLDDVLLGRATRRRQCTIDFQLLCDNRSPRGTDMS